MPLIFNYPINTVINSRSHREVTLGKFQKKVLLLVDARNLRIVTSLNANVTIERNRNAHRNFTWPTFIRNYGYL